MVMGPCFRRDDGGEVVMTTSNQKFRTGSKEAPTEPFKRAVTACLRAIAKKPELEVTFAGERPRPRRFDRAETRLPRSESASQADAGKSAGARRVRGGRAGPRRGARLAADGGGCEKPHRDARRSFPSRQVRRDH